ncbi:MAG: hypothetical protein K0U98_06170 [Deltaproteobacteria bacterium]|nr:hypothetical protein [Deltaproteobacteria bacterium]
MTLRDANALAVELLTVNITCPHCSAAWDRAEPSRVGKEFIGVAVFCQKGHELSLKAERVQTS